MQIVGEFKSNTGAFVPLNTFIGLHVFIRKKQNTETENPVEKIR